MICLLYMHLPNRRLPTYVLTYLCTYATQVRQPGALHFHTADPARALQRSAHPEHTPVLRNSAEHTPVLTTAKLRTKFEMSSFDRSKDDLKFRNRSRDHDDAPVWGRVSLQGGLQRAADPRRAGGGQTAPGDGQDQQPVRYERHAQVSGSSSSR